MLVNVGCFCALFVLKIPAWDTEHYRKWGTEMFVRGTPESVKGGTQGETKF